MVLHYRLHIVVCVLHYLLLENAKQLFSAIYTGFYSYFFHLQNQSSQMGQIYNVSFFEFCVRLCFDERISASFLQERGS